ncbi:hypothetical protein [Helicobacter zhangjianzhongii]|uniref:Uncharacterized protein n=1 Tax=Helicobacter zhangjianzhongii TaxID=2974574 RepID=A0ACC6FP73_9HELI|nr:MULTISPECIES: hypothetical protein [unclassified Helicobacter]MDL0079062.1 hypothetical protein [Helicobacter sp. CPD2-1]MDL0081088.1 hypothetical protein [Helicobacter sp. XJK30-2]
MDSRSNTHLLSSQALAQDKARRSIHTKHTLESTFQRDLALGNHSGDFLSSRADEPLFLSSRASETSVAIHKGAKVDSSAKMDCHAAATAASRNDKKQHH